MLSNYNPTTFSLKNFDNFKFVFPCVNHNWVINFLFTNIFDTTLPYSEKFISCNGVFL